jgi:hypothetical protein
MTAGLDPEMLRVLVREALADLLPAETGAAGPPPAQPAPVGSPPAQPPPASPPAALAPASSAPAQDGAAYTVRDGVAEVETVSVRTDRELAAFVTRLLHLVENPRRRDDLRTEAAVRDAARAGARLVLGRRAVLTPLARDRARAAGVEIEKER